TLVLNESTSTTTRQSACGPSRALPSSPHSKRTAPFACHCHVVTHGSMPEPRHRRYPVRRPTPAYRPTRLGFPRSGRTTVAPTRRRPATAVRLPGTARSARQGVEDVDDLLLPLQARDVSGPHRVHVEPVLRREGIGLGDHAILEGERDHAVERVPDVGAWDPPPGLRVDRSVLAGRDNGLVRLEGVQHGEELLLGRVL